MNAYILRLFCSTIITFLTTQATANDGKSNMIIISIKLPDGIKDDSISIEFRKQGAYKPMYPYTSLKSKNINGIAEFKINSQSSLHLLFPVLIRRGVPAFLLSPGDEVAIDARQKNLQISGKGSEKINLLQSISKRIRLLRVPEKKRLYTLENFYMMSNFYDSSNMIIEEELTLASATIPHNILHQIKAELITDNEDDRLLHFELTRRQPLYKNEMQLFCKIYDSLIVNTQYKWLCSLTEDAGFSEFYFSAVKAQIRRNDGHMSNESNSDKDPGIRRRKQYYEQALTMFKGKILANVMYTIIGREGFHHYGFIPEINELLNRFYQSDAFDAEVKQNMQVYEKKERIRWATAGKTFELPILTRKDPQGNDIFMGPDNFKDKLLLLNFYNPQEANKDLTSPITNRFSDCPLLLVANIAVKQPIPGIPLLPATWHLKESPSDSALTAVYGISSLPAIFLYSSYGSFLKAYYPAEEHIESEALVAVITEQLQYMNDGPYVFNEDARQTIITLEQGKLRKTSFEKKKGIVFTVNTDTPGTTFSVTLADSLKIPPAVYPEPEKLLVLSDLEGNFKALRQLLQHNNIIDENLNWKFKNGHLAILGDVFDRGQQVTECLWLIYNLEQQAAVHGGYLHFILGNHEIMNLTGHLGYQAPKYKNNTALLKLTHAQLYAPNSELGKWLRTKNVVEKIGSSLLTHGGISPEVIRLGLQPADINGRIRRFLAKTNDIDTTMYILTDALTSPYWYRGYYKNSNETLAIKNLNNVLDVFDVKQVITGHTIVEKITEHYNGRLFNTDTHHAKGISEGLLITSNIFYRISNKGEPQKIWPE